MAKFGFGSEVSVEDAVAGLRGSVCGLARDVEQQEEDAVQAFLLWVREDKEISDKLETITLEHLQLGIGRVRENGMGAVPLLVRAGILSAWLMGYVAGRSGNHG